MSTNDNQGIRPTAPPGPIVTVGIDFGTSAIKIALRELRQPKSVLLPAPRSTGGGDGSGRPETYLWPSVLHLHDGQICVSRNGCGHAVGARHSVRWLKMLLRRKRIGEAPNPMLDAVRRNLKEAGLCPTALATLLLAYHMREARRMAEQYFDARARGSPRLTFQVAAPLEAASADVASANTGKETFDSFSRAAFLAERLSLELPEGECWDETEVICRYRDLHARHRQLPDEKTRVSFVMAETLAGMLGLSRDVEPGLHAVVDVGAGTTDVAVFRHTRNGKGLTSYYGDAVLPRASMHADATIGKHLCDGDPDRLGHLDAASRAELGRVVKEHGRAVVGDRELGLSAKEVERLVHDLTRELQSHYTRTLSTSLLEKDRKALRGSLRLTLLGGGSRFTPFADGLSSHKPLGNTYLLHLGSISPKTANAFGGDCPIVGIEPQHAHLFAVAHGLSLHPVLVGDVHLPIEVEDDTYNPSYSPEPYLRNDDT